MYEITNVLSLSDNEIVKSPFMSVMVPIVVPFTIIVAPITGSPSSADNIFPVMEV